MAATISALPALRPLTSIFGAQVLDIDLSQPPDDRTFAAVEAAFDDHGLLVFRDQRLTENEHVAFSRRFGVLDTVMLKQYLHPQFPEIFVVSNIVENGRSIGSNDAGQFWHTDGSHFDVPPRGSLLYAREVPHKDGKVLGDTLFASMYAAYDSLDTAMKKQLEPLQAVHGYGERYARRLKVIKSREGTHEELDRQERDARVATHPVIRAHPRTGRKCLYVNAGLTTGIVGLQPKESAELLAELFAHCVRPEHVYRHRWRVGDLVMWDNCSTQHCAVSDYALPQRRLMHRTTIRGIA